MLCKVNQASIDLQPPHWTAHLLTLASLAVAGSVPPHIGRDREVLQEVQVRRRPVLSLVAKSVLRSVDDPGRLGLHLHLNDVKREKQSWRQDRE